MKKVLMISKYFAPQNTIAAIRPTKLMKYMKSGAPNQYSFTVITVDANEAEIKDQLLESDLQYADLLIPVSEENHVSRFFWKIIHKAQKKAGLKKMISGGQGSLPSTGVPFQGKSKAILKELWIFILFCMDSLNRRNYYCKAKKYVKKANEDYDIIFSTFGPSAVHLIGRYAKKRNPQALWIADFRDGPLNDYIPALLRRYYHSYPNRVCKMADIVTAVSQGVLEELELPNKTKKVVISNGYDSDDIQGFPSKTPNEKMTFTYTGTLYKGKSDLTPFFHALSELIDQNLIKRDKIQIQYAGLDTSQFMEQAALFHLDDIVVSYGNVERKQSLSLQWKSDVLLLASWNMNGKTGIITGKMLEYMMMDRPILSLVSGNVPNSKINQITSECELGFCYEQINGEDDYRRLKEYILHQYWQFSSVGSAEHKANQKAIAQYDYKNIAEHFRSLVSQ